MDQGEGQVKQAIEAAAFLSFILMLYLFATIGDVAGL